MHEFHIENKFVSAPQEIDPGFGQVFSEIGSLVKYQKAI